MFCAFCGGANPDDGAFCAHCGQPLRPNAQQQVPPPVAAGPAPLGEPTQQIPPPMLGQAPTMQVPPPVPGQPAQELAGPYTCRVCGYVLGPVDTVCTRCKTPRGMQVNPESPIPGAYTQAGAWGNVNTSGQQGDVPAELRGGWNWGAFSLSFIWGLNHKAYLTLLIFLTLVCGLFAWLPLSVWYGIKGNEWAWQGRRFDSIEHFRQVQRIWMYWGIGVFVLDIVLFIAYIAFVFTMFASGMAGPSPRPF